MKRFLSTLLLSIMTAWVLQAANISDVKVTRSGDTVDVQVIAEGKINFFSSESEVLPATIPEDPSVPYTKTFTSYYIASGNDLLTEVHCANYKKVLRAHMENRPELAEKIGKKGFRFSNLEEVIQAYNRD